jgi:sugar phosphate permease
MPDPVPGGRVSALRLDPRHGSYRFVVLFFVALLTFGSYFAYDSVGAIAPTLVTALGIGREAIGQMYTVYSVAAILSVFIGGLLIDRIGTRRASLLFSGLVTAGALIVAIAPNLWILYLGRFVFGWRVRVARRGTKRDFRQVVQGEGARPLVRDRPDAQPPRDPLQFQHVRR